MKTIDTYSWHDIQKICKQLVDKIDEEFDVIVALMRGGAVPAVILANELNIHTVISVSVKQVGQLTGVGEGIGAYKAEKGLVVVPLNDIDLNKKRVLVVDDVLDSGESLKIVLELLGNKGASIVKTAVMQKKTYSKIEPDYYVETKENWLFYPWMSEAEKEEMNHKLAQLTK